MDRLVGRLVFGLLAVAAGGCAHMCDLAPCTGGCCRNGADFFAGLLVPSCGECTVGACSDCGGEPCTCGAPAAVDEGCAAPVGSIDSCAAAPDACESCDGPAFSICRPQLLHALFGCTGCDDEYYWSEWFSDPPQCCDSCDDHGHWTGYCDGSPSSPHTETMPSPLDHATAACPNCGKVH
jgi:hypothetical protein